MPLFRVGKSAQVSGCAKRAVFLGKVSNAGMGGGVVAASRSIDSRGSPPTEPVSEGGSMPTTYGEPGRSGHYGAPRPYCHIGLLLNTTWVFTHHCRSNPVDNSKTKGKYAQPDLRKRELRARASLWGIPVQNMKRPKKSNTRIRGVHTCIR